MFKRFDYSLKKKFKYQLESTAEFYRIPLEYDEEKAIDRCWSNVENLNYSIMIDRLQKHENILGIYVQSEYNQNLGGYLHKIRSIINGGIISHTNIRVHDLVLEVNGVNLLQLTFDQLSLLLYSLPEYIQIVYARPNRHNESQDISNESTARPSSRQNIKYSTDKVYFEEPVKLIIEAKHKFESGITFRDINYSPQMISKTEISEVLSDNKRSYFEQDNRIKPKDCIVRINKTDVSHFNSHQLSKLIESKSGKTMMLWVRKWTGISTDWIDNGVKTSATLLSKESISKSSRRLEATKPISRSSSKSVPNLHKKVMNEKISNRKKSHLYQSGTQLNTNNEETDNRDVYEQLDAEPREVEITPNDDISMYLQQNGHSSKDWKTLIIGFRPNSSLLRKLFIGDEILAINNIDVRGCSSMEVGKIIHSIHHKGSNVLLKVVQTYSSSEFNSDWIISDTPTTNTESSDSSSICLHETRFKETVYRIFNEETGKAHFGFKIFSAVRPTIVAVDFKNSQIRAGDMIERMNDVYVFDKDRDFILQFIHSCGDSINLELIRISNSKLQDSLMNIPPPLLPTSVNKYDIEDTSDFPLPPPPSLEELESINNLSVINGNITMKQSENVSQDDQAIRNNSASDFTYHF